jgi:hypothetical protein
MFLKKKIREMHHQKKLKQTHLAAALHDARAEGRHFTHTTGVL